MLFHLITPKNSNKNSRPFKERLKNEYLLFDQIFQNTLLAILHKTHQLMDVLRYNQKRA